MPRESKTLAVLLDGSVVAPFETMSGLSEHSSKYTKNNTSWILEVMDLYEVIGHIPKTHPYDGGVKYQYYCCHAEKKMIARILTLLGLRGQCMKNTQKPQSIQILVTSEICADCRAFAKAVSLHFEIKIELIAEHIVSWLTMSFLGLRD
jgi:hypothetical protein